MAFSYSAKQSIFVFSGTLTSRVLGFIRLVLISTTLGYTRLADSYSLANETPNMMYELMLGSLIASTMIPFFVEQYKRKDKKADQALMSFVFISALLLTVFTMVLAPFLADLMTALNTSSTGEAQRNLVVFFLMFFLPQIFFYAMTAAMQAYLNARSKFIAAAFVPIVNNIVVIAVVLYIKTRIDELNVNLDQVKSLDLTFILGIGTTLGVALITIFLSFAYISAGGSFKLTSIRHSNVRSLITRSKWMVASAVVNQLTLFIIIAFANSIPGGVAMYLVAWSFFQLPHGLIANSIMTTMVPRITHTLNVGKDNMNHIRMGIETALLTKQVGTGLIVLMSGFTALTIAVASPAIVILISHGEISIEQGEHTARVLIGFVSLLPAFSLYLFGVRLANSFNITRTAFFINVAQNLLNIILAYFLKDSFSTVGLAFAFSASYFLVLPITIYVTSKCLEGPMIDIKVSLFMFLTSLGSGAAGYFASISTDNRFLGLLYGSVICLGLLGFGALFVRRSLIDLIDLVYMREKKDSKTRKV